MGIDPAPGEPRKPPEALAPRILGFLGALVAVLYAVGMIVRGDTVPGLVGGALAGVLTFMVLRRAQEQREARWRRREGGGQ